LKFRQLLTSIIQSKHPQYR